MTNKVFTSGIIILCLIGIGNFGIAQRSKIDLSAKNAAKVSLIPSVVGTISLSYERFIFDNQSVNIFGGLRLSNTVPKFFDIALDDSIMESTTADYWSVGVSYRWYIDNCDEKLHTGLYVSPYFKYNDYKLNHALTGDSNFFNFDVEINEIGLGVQVGYLWRFHKNFAIDFLFFGPRTGLYRVRYKVDADLTSVDQEILDQVSDALGNFYKPISFSNPSFEFEGASTVQVTNRNSWWNWRYGISFVVTF